MKPFKSLDVIITPGLTTTHHGYLRITAGPNRGKLHHRQILAELCIQFCYYPLMPDGLPFGFTVDHLDHNRKHNCHQNLILLQAEIHRAISWDSWRGHKNRR